MTDGAVEESDLTALRERVDPELTPIFGRSFELGFLGGMSIADQIDHALGFVAVLEEERGGPPTSVVDLGTGGGMPGLVLVSCWPKARIVLMDASERRTTFLTDVIDGWGRAERVEVLRGRAEELGRHPELREHFECVTSRSFGLPAATAECGSAFLQVGGSMAISEPPDEEPLERWPQEGLRQLGLIPAATTRPDMRFGFQVLRKTEPLNGRFPRRVGIPVKRPIF